MASLKREEEFRINHERYAKVKKHFTIAFWAAMIPSGIVFVLLAIYYAIRGLALLAGAEMFWGQKIINDELGTNDTTGLTFSTPYLYMFFLFLIGAASFIAFYFKLRKPHKFVFIVYAVGAVYGLAGMLLNWCGLLMGMYLIVYGIYGMWLQDFILRLHKELDYLALQEGYPDFIVALNEPRPMVNTSGLHYNQSEFLKRQQKEKKENGEEAAMPSMAEMDDLTIDTPLPKGSRKIDNMM